MTCACGCGRPAVRDRPFARGHSIDAPVNPTHLKIALEVYDERLSDEERQTWSL